MSSGNATHFREQPLADGPRIGVLILNRNGRRWLAPLYESLRAQDYPRARVYLVDNASEDDSVDLTCSGYPEVTVLRMPANLGFCMAYNLAMPVAFADGCNWVVWANNDILIQSGCLGALADAVRGAQRIGVIGPAFLAWDSDEPNYYMRGKHPGAIPAMLRCDATPVDVDWVEGSFLMVSRECVADVGPLDPWLFLYWEETDFCRRARLRGWRVALAPNAIVRHYAKGWSERDKGNRAAASWLRAHNFYVYAFCDPERSFVRNAFEAIHALAVELKKSLLSLDWISALIQARAFWTVAIAEFGTIRRKWRNDRHGIHPAPTIAAFQDAKVLVLRAGVSA
jgi:GT2 family glycosyltransferase